ncbi:hypothetical protein [Sinomicrobium sp. M5D2P17]
MKTEDRLEVLENKTIGALGIDMNEWEKEFFF